GLPGAVRHTRYFLAAASGNRCHCPVHGDFLRLPEHAVHHLVPLVLAQTTTAADRTVWRTAGGDRNARAGHLQPTPGTCNGVRAGDGVRRSPYLHFVPPQLITKFPARHSLGTIVPLPFYLRVALNRRKGLMRRI